MSKRHQASRRRTYGRRQHEIHERADRFDSPGVWIETSELQEVAGGWSHEPADRESGGGWLQAPGID